MFVIFMKFEWFLLGWMGAGFFTLFFFPEPESNFVWYFLTWVVFVVGLFVLVRFYNKG